MKFLHHPISDARVAYDGDDISEYIKEGFVEYPDFKSMPMPAKSTPDYVSKVALKYALGPDWALVKSAIDADPDLKEDWDLANWIYRDSPLVNSVGKSIGFTDSQLDDIFIAAEKAKV